MNEIVKKIKEMGYWRFHIQPTIFEAEKIPLNECESIIRNAVVELRGWPYPLYHLNIRPDRGQDWIQVAQDFGDEIEAWRMYQSGQFIHYLGLREDRERVASFAKSDPRFAEVKPGDILGVEWTVYLITEFFEFLSRLAKQGIYKDGVRVDLGLFNTKNRRLFVVDQMRADFFSSHRTGDEKLTYPTQNLSEEEITNRSRELASEVLVWFLERFQWETPNIKAINEMQERLFNRNL